MTYIFNLADVDQIQHAPSKQFYRVTFHFLPEFIVKIKDIDSNLRINFTVESEALKFIEHARKVSNTQEKALNQKMFIIRKLSIPSDKQEAKQT